jgi:aminoglycoside phosphotransferase (APT) family kinase protein
VLTEADVRALLDTDAPLHRMCLNDEFDVWSVGDDLVAKFPRTDVDAGKVPIEEAVHPTLRMLLGDVVPAIRMTGSIDGSDRRFIVHERASGRQAQTDDGVTVAPGDGLAADISRILATLHQVRAVAAHDLGVGTRELSSEIQPLSDATITRLTEIAGDAVLRFLEEGPPEPSKRRTLCHTDIKGEHVFVDGDAARVTSIIDWADTEVCDPAKDYAGLVIWLGPSFTRACAEASGEDDPTLADRAIWIGRAEIVAYWDEVIAGVERAPMPLITQQLRTAFQ